MSDLKDRFDTLTPKEWEVVPLLAQRLFSKEIARRLSVTAEAVDKRIIAIRQKLGAQNRREVARLYEEYLYLVENKKDSVPDQTYQPPYVVSPDELTSDHVPEQNDREHDERVQARKPREILLILVAIAIAVSAAANAVSLLLK